MARWIPFQGDKGGNTVVSPGATSETVIVNAGGKWIQLANSGANICHVRIGSDENIGATTGDTPVLPGEILVLRKDRQDDLVSYISAAGTNLHIQTQGGYDSSLSSNAFSSTWDTNNPGTSANNQITIPVQASGTYHSIVDWGDGNVEIITSGTAPEWTHTYSSPGVYTVNIRGIFNGFRFASGGDKDKILSVNQCGILQVGNDGNYFQGCSNLQWLTSDPIDMKGTTNCSYFFESCTNFNGQINNWDMSQVTTIELMLSQCTAFSRSIAQWDVSNVVNFDGFISDCPSYNDNLNNWNTSSVTSMGFCFRNCSSFNSPLSNWDTSNVTYMELLFSGCTVFNQNINSWNVSNVTDMGRLFQFCSRFNEPLNNWNVSSVTNMERIFQQAFDFNQPLDKWDVSSVTSFLFAFNTTLNFNQNINSWNVSNVTNMRSMFAGAAVFNQPVSNWNVSSVTNMRGMFFLAFEFDQDVSAWNVSNVTDMLFMFNGSKFSQVNYDKLLVAWDQLTLQNNVFFSAGFAKYGAGAPATARANIISTYSWTISDGGPA